jgi:hypothetical protein
MLRCEKPAADPKSVLRKQTQKHTHTHRVCAHIQQQQQQKNKAKAREQSTREQKSLVSTISYLGVVGSV